MQAIALLLVGTGLVDGVYVQVVGQDTRTCPVVSLEHDGVVLVAIGDIGITLLQGLILWTASPGVGQTTVGCIVGADPLGDTTAAVIAGSGRAVGLDTRLREAVALQTELHGMGTVARDDEDNLGIAREVLLETVLVVGGEAVLAAVDDALHLGQTFLVAVVIAGAQIDVLVQIELGEGHRAGVLVAIAVHIVIADTGLGLCELRDEEVVHLLGGHLLRQIASLHILRGLQGHVAEHIKEVIVEHRAEEAGVGQALLCRGVGRVDGVDHLVGIADAAIGNLPGVVDLIHRGTPVVLVQVDVGIAPAHTDAGRHHILVCRFLKQVIHAEPVLHQVAVLSGGSAEQQREVGLVGEVDVRLIEVAV